VEAAPPQARRAGSTPPSWARRAGAAAPPPSLASLMARLTPCAFLRKEKLLDSLLGDRRRWCWGFLGAAVNEVLGRPGFILTRRQTIKRSVNTSEPMSAQESSWPQKSCGHKETCDCSYFYSKYQMPNYCYELFNS
jgi:hypothetical protein